MVTARVTSKGQVTIPKRIRDRLKLCPGDRVDFAEGEGEARLKKLPNDDPFETYRGYLKHLAGKRSDDFVDEMRGR